MARLHMLEGLHLTPAERRAIAAIITAGATQGRTARKAYTIQREGEAFRVRIVTRERDDYGRPSPSTSTALVTLA